MNSIRVWGGGIYEQDIFYELCDSLGLMVWQDFMFANTMYPTEPEFVDNMMEEVKENVMRLHHHPSIIHWCGNNEIDVAWHNWGWPRKYGIPKNYQKKLKNQYDVTFKEKIPTLVSSLIPNVNYSHTSPLSNWGTDENYNHHSMHYWGVFHGEDPFEKYAENVGRFNSEYGFQSFPNISLINEYFKPEKFDLKDPLLSHRQKSYKGNRLIYKHIDHYYPEPTTMTELSYISQITQAKGISYAIQSHRINKEQCMGTLFWQLNDCWPAISWSSIDSDGTWRALQYASREAYADAAVYVDSTNYKMDIVVLNDRPQPLSGQCRLSFYNEGEMIFSDRISVTTDPYSILRHDLFQYHAKLPHVEYLHIELLDENGNLTYDKTHVFVQPKRLQLQKADIDKTWSKTEDGLMLTLESDTFVKSLYMYSEEKGHLSENFVDLYPGEKLIVYIRTDADLDAYSKGLKHLSLNDILGENHDN